MKLTDVNQMVHKIKHQQNYHNMYYPADDKHLLRLHHMTYLHYPRMSSRDSVEELGNVLYNSLHPVIH
jgi:hypothetical protein